MIRPARILVPALALALAAPLTARASEPSTVRITAGPGTQLDLALVVDGSSSISGSDFDFARLFSKRVVQSCLAAGDTQAAVVQFAGEGSTSVRQTLTADDALLTDAIDQMVKEGFGTDIQEAIQVAQAQLAAGRAGAEKRMIVITDGEQSSPGDPVAEATTAKNAGTRIFVVGVGSAVDHSAQIDAIASDPDDDHVVPVASFDTLDAALATTTGDACGTAPVTPGRYNSLDNPARVLDTRVGPGPLGKVAADAVLGLTVAGVGAVPATATAVLLNTTVTQTDGQGYLTVWGCGSPRPLASNLNYVADDEAANLVAVKVGANGQVCFSPGEAGTHLVVDVAGYFDNSGSLYNPLTPNRFADTRSGARVTADGVLGVPVAGVGAVPPGATAAILNATITQPTAPGFLTVWPCGPERPLASNVNYSSFDVANLVAARIGADGQVCFSPDKSTHVVADVMGWFGATGDAYEPVFPTRFLDSRIGQGFIFGAIKPDEVGRVLAIDRAGSEPGVGGTPDTASAVMVNVTVTEAEADGYLTVWPCDVDQPYVSNINFRKGDTVPNLAAVRVGADGHICIATSAETDVIMDVVGFFQPA